MLNQGIYLSLSLYRYNGIIRFYMSLPLYVILPYSLNRGRICVTLQRNLSNFMNAIRSSRKQSITEFAEEIGISRSEMQQILKGTCNLRIDTVKYIADKLNVDPLILLFPSYSKSQQEFALLLLNTLNAFSKLPKEKQDEAAKLFHKLILMMEENLNVK